MDENQKRRFDALHDVGDQAWRDWDHKSRAEWRLTFGVWVALLAASASVSKTEVTISWQIAGAVGFGVVLFHLNFLRWIQNMLTASRSEMQRSQEEMYELTDLVWVASARRPWWRQVSLWTQAGITVLLVLVFVMLSLQKSTANGPGTIKDPETDGPAASDAEPRVANPPLQTDRAAPDR